MTIASATSKRCVPFQIYCQHSIADRLLLLDSRHEGNASLGSAKATRHLPFGFFYPSRPVRHLVSDKPRHGPRQACDWQCGGTHAFISHRQSTCPAPSGPSVRTKHTQSAGHSKPLWGLPSLSFVCNPRRIGCSLAAAQFRFCRGGHLLCSPAHTFITETIVELVI